MHPSMASIIFAYITLALARFIKVSRPGVLSAELHENGHV